MQENGIKKIYPPTSSSDPHQCRSDYNEPSAVVNDVAAVQLRQELRKSQKKWDINLLEYHLQ